MERYDARQLDAVLGPAFVAALGTMPAGEWAGPVESTRGWHLVRLERFTAPEPLPDEELQRRLRADSSDAQRSAARAARVGSLRERYEVVLPGTGDLR